MSPGICKNGLCNFSPVTRSPCECDKAFVRCLKKAKTRVANALGKVFFNVAGLTCYKYDYPIKVKLSDHIQLIMILNAYQSQCRIFIIFVPCIIWVLHIAKVGYFFLPSLPNVEWLFFFYQKSFIFYFLEN